MTEKRRVLYIYSGKMRGKGLDLVVHHQLKALTDSGFRIDFISRGRFFHNNVCNYCLPLTPANLISFFPSAYYYNAQNRFFSFIASFLIKFVKYDLIISWTRQSLSLFREAKKTGICCVLNNAGCHYNFPLGVPNWRNRIWPCFKKKDYEEMYSLADSLLVASKIAAKSFEINGYPKETIYDIGRGADMVQFSPGEDKKDGIFRVVFLGNVSDRKGIFQLIEAWEKADLRKAELWIIGAVPKDIEKSLIEELPHNATLWGFRQNPETLMKRCHVQVLLSRREGLAKSLIEGAACGLITIATPQSGFPVQEGETGFFVERENPEKVAELLRYLQSNASARESMSKKSREYVERNLRWDSFRDRFLVAVKSTHSKKTK